MRFSFDADDLRPLVASIVAEVMRQRDETDAGLGDRLGFPEPEAAAMISVKPHVLRDMRLRGEIVARKVGRSYRYSRRQLLNWLETSE